jgi:iron only hydrogenase large subunit-like protein
VEAQLVKGKEYFHSVRLDKDKCKGCTNCIRGCPTEAIRVRGGKAKIIDERCIDCGECIRVCPHHAKIAYTDTLDATKQFKYKIALPAPSLYGQFREIENVQSILIALKAIGFDDVFEVAKGADIITEAIKRRLDEVKTRPLISSACPSIVRLIQVRFPELIENIVDAISPMEMAAKTAKLNYAHKHGVDDADIGVFFITPCPAKMTVIKNTLGSKKSYVDGAISILDIYGLLANKFGKESDGDIDIEFASAFGVGWANSGGEVAALNIDRYLAVDGINNVIKVLEEIENGKLDDLDYLEVLSCTGGCVGGPLTVENCYVSKNNIKRIFNMMNEKGQLDYKSKLLIPDYSEALFDDEINPVRVMKLDDNRKKAMQMMKTLEKIEEGLPGLDCGSCGSPSCRTLAEDIVRGHAKEIDCIFILKDRLKELAGSMTDFYDHEREKGEL